MNTRRQQCSDQQLDILLDGVEDSAEYASAASHLEQCADCRERLTQLSGEDAYWIELKEMLQPLNGYDTDDGSLHRHRGVSASLSSYYLTDESSVVGLLEPPSHPEMLGRLGRYEIERIVGAGGMGVVFKGFDVELHRPVAIKMLAPHLARVGAARQRFAREARAAAAVVHEHVVAIHDVESDCPNPYLVMQFVPGESLQVRVAREGPLAVEEILRIGLQAADGLAAAHAQGLVHRDVKPANILLENDVDRAYLTDFGLARASDDASLTYTGVVAGTPHYMSPEQADGQVVDDRSDQFSLGSVLYFMATGHPPFRAERPMAVLKRTCHDSHRPVRQINAAVPDSLSRIIDRLLHKNRNRRYGGATEVRVALASALSEFQQGKSRFSRRSRTGVFFGLSAETSGIRRLATAAAMVSLLAAFFLLVSWTLPWGLRRMSPVAAER